VAHQDIANLESESKQTAIARLGRMRKAERLDILKRKNLAAGKIRRESSFTESPAGRKEKRIKMQ
jgi:hypothetical protein